MYIEPVEIIKNSVLTITLSLIMIAFFDLIVLLVSMINNRYIKIILEVKDFILVFFYTIVFITMLYYFSDGRFRGIYLISLFLGIYLYYHLFSDIWRKICGIIFIPLECIVKMIVKIIRKLYIFFCKTIEKIEFKMYNKNKNYKTDFKL